MRTGLTKSKADPRHNRPWLAHSVLRTGQRVDMYHIMQPSPGSVENPSTANVDCAPPPLVLCWLRAFRISSPQPKSSKVRISVTVSCCLKVKRGKKLIPHVPTVQEHCKNIFIRELLIQKHIFL